jgi:hypothetical protein
MRVRNIAVLAILGAGVALTGCGRGNGLPGDLTAHLAAQGITLKAIRAEAPISSRAGYLVAQYDPQTATNLISRFNLQIIPSGDPQWRLAIQRAGSKVAAKEVWGLAGRPPQFKLSNGSQFQYFYLLITSDGWMYLLAEYAYG